MLGSSQERQYMDLQDEINFDERGIRILEESKPDTKEQSDRRDEQLRVYREHLSDLKSRKQSK